MTLMKFKTGDLVKFIHSSNLLMGVHSNLIGEICIVISYDNELDDLEGFYLVSFSDRIVSVTEYQIEPVALKLQ